MGCVGREGADGPFFVLLAVLVVVKEGEEPVPDLPDLSAKVMIEPPPNTM